MKIETTWNGRSYRAKLEDGIDLSSPYGGENALSAWSCQPVSFNPVQLGDWTGSVKEGADVNFFDICLNPHGNGTHTEWAGHILPDRGSVNRQLKRFWFMCRLMDLQVSKDGSMNFTGDQLKPDLPEAVILRHRPSSLPAGNDFTGTNPPFLSEDVARRLCEKGVQHLLIDLPSVDPEKDGGALRAHKAFWDVEGELRKGATITELLNIPEHIEEGLYFLELQLAPIENDASPSRPVLYPLEHGS